MLCQQKGTVFFHSFSEKIPEGLQLTGLGCVPISEPITVDRGMEASEPGNACHTECTARGERELGWLMKGRKSMGRLKQ